jgi:hypothetical protein
VPAYNFTTQEAGKEGLQIPGQTGLHSETLSQKTNKQTNKQTKTKGKREIPKWRRYLVNI